jgi:excisionase family DNA binding protein
MTASMLTTLQVAVELGTKTDSVLALIHGKHLAAVDISAGGLRRRWRISREALDAFKAARGSRGETPRQRKPRKPARIIQFY